MIFSPGHSVADVSLSNHHNIFEIHHCFIGWLGLAASTTKSTIEKTNANKYQATWIFVILGNTYDITLGQWRADANALLSAQELWFTIFMTILWVFFPLLSDDYC